MSEYTISQLNTQFENLPEMLKEAITSTETAQAIKKISEQHKLHIDEAGKLANETGLVMFGLTRPYMFTTRLSRALNIDKDKAEKIAQAVNAQIFSPIQDYLKNPPQTEEKQTPAPQSIFDQKMKNLFTTSGPTTPNPYQRPSHDDPYREPAE